MPKLYVLVQIKQTWLTAFTGIDPLIAASICEREAAKGRPTLLVEIDHGDDPS